MNNRSGIFIFFLFLFLAVVILLQVLSMIQSDRLFERVNRLEKTIQNTGSFSGQPRQGVSSARDPNEGDWLVIGMSGEPSTLNPITATDAGAVEVMSGMMQNGSIFESLLQYDPEKLKLVPQLAESYEISPDGLEITFKLRNDTWFSDGKPVTAEDVLFSFKTIKDPNVDAAHAANYFNNVTDAEIIDSRTIRFKLNQVYFKALEAVGTLSVIPRHIYQYKNATEFNNRRSDPVGSGPYIFEKWEVGRQIVLRRNERYWGPRPAIDKIVYKFINNEIAAIQALRSHEIDTLEPSAEQFATLSNDPQFKEQFQSISYWTPRGAYSYLGWSCANPILSDKQVRLALTHTVNRELIRVQISKGLSKIIATPFYIYGPQNDPNIKPWPYDPDKAAQILDNAGWKDTNGNGIRDKNGTELKLRFMIVSGSPAVERIAKIIKDGAAKVGIDINIEPFEWSVMISRLKDHNFDATMGGWGGTIEEDPYQIWHSSQISDRGSNYISYKNPEVDSLIEQARKTLDDDKRNQLYHRFAHILHQEQPYTFMFTRPELRFIDKRFKNIKAHKLGLDEHEWYVPKEQQRYK